MKVKTSELEGIALNWAVAGLVHTERWRHEKYEGGLFASMHGYTPSTDWSQCGPLIEEYKIITDPPDGMFPSWCAWLGIDAGDGPTALIAICRAIVSAKLGDTVDIPDELVSKDEIT